MIAASVRCPVCGCEESEAMALGLLACRACGCVQQSRPLHENRASILADQTYAPPDEARQRSATGLVQHLESFVSGRPRLFDVGFGDGALLRAAATRNWFVGGIDIAPRAIETACDLGPTVETGDFLHSPRDESSYDVVSFLYSLEQFEDVDAALARARAMLDPDGILCIELVPLQELRSRAADAVQAQLPARIWFPEAEHVRELLWTRGFKIEEESAGVGWRWIARRF